MQTAPLAFAPTLTPIPALLCTVCSPAHICVQVKGTVSITEFTTGSDHDDLIIAVTAEGTGAAQEALEACIAALRGELCARLDQYAAEFAEIS